MTKLYAQTDSDIGINDSYWNSLLTQVGSNASYTSLPQSPSTGNDKHFLHEQDGRDWVDNPPKKVANSHAWEKPVSFTKDYSLSPFPVEALPTALQEIALAVAESTQTPVDMSAVKTLAAVATCVQGKFNVQGKTDHIEPLNLYVVSVLPPAERKSAVDGHINKPLGEYEKLQNEKRKHDIARSKAKKEALQKRIDKLKAKYASGGITAETDLFNAQDELTNFVELKPLRLQCDDVTPEALSSLLADNGGNISVISSEGGIFEILKGRYSQGVNIDVFLKGHSGDPLRIDRKGREPEYVESPCLTVSLSIQPQVLSGMGSEEFRGRGLLGRFLYCIPKSRIGERKYETKPIPEATKKMYCDLIYELLDIEQHKEPTMLKLTHSAYMEYVKFQDEFEPRLIDDLADIPEWAGKLCGAVLRIAGILHLVECISYRTPFIENPEISEGTIQSAIRIGCYFIEHSHTAHEIMGGIDENVQHAKYILEKVQKHNLSRFSKTELVRICRKFKSTAQLTEPLALLAQHHYLKEQSQVYNGHGRQPEPIYIINPVWERD